MNFLSRRMHSRRTLTAKSLADAILNALPESATSNYGKTVQTFNQNSCGIGKNARKGRVTEKINAAREGVGGMENMLDDRSSR